MVITLKAIVIVGTLLTPGSFEYAKSVADRCESATSWIENLGYPGGAGPYVGVCGDDMGNPIVNTCEQTAELHYAMALGAGAVADAAYEDAIASCEE